MAARDAGDHAVSGRYVRRERLGSGGFGVVWRAHDTLLRRDVAMKEIAMPSVLDERDQAAVRERVLREARAAARLSHPGLVSVYDVAEEGGRPVIVMELVDAPTLGDLVARDGPLDDVRAAAIAARVLDALEAAHAQGVVHRDVKPGNVMVHDSGRVQLADFGVASVADDPRVTGSGRMAGSPSYMSPEQAEGRPASPATDLWGLGATLYFACEGRAPFARATALATLASVVSDEPRPLDRTGPLATLVGDLLAKDPGDRPSLAEVRRRLAEVAAGTAVEAGGTVDAGEGTEPGADPGTATLEDPQKTTAVRGGPVTARIPAGDLGPMPPPPPLGGGRPARSRSRGRSGPPEPPPVRRHRPVGGVLAIAVVLAVAAAAIGVVLYRSTGSRPAPGGGAPEPAGSGGAVPQGWVRYDDPVTGFSIAHPSDWSVRTSGTLTDFVDPGSGAYLRVDHQKPPGPSPVAAWEALEARFATQYPGYERIRLEPTTYKGLRAALWEFTYTDGGARLRAVDLGFVTDDYGFALNFQTRTRDWERLQPVFERFKSSFEPPD